MSRFRVTVRDASIELRGFIDGEDVLRTVADDMAPAAVVASPAEDDYNPFEETQQEASLRTIMNVLEQYGYTEEQKVELPTLIEIMADLHGMQARVIRGERARADALEVELRDRELHHFEVEQENTRLKGQA